MSINQTYGAQGLSETTALNLVVKADNVGPDRVVPVMFQTNSSGVAFTITANTSFTENATYYQANIALGTSLAKRILPKAGLVGNNRRIICMPGNASGVFQHIHMEISTGGTIRFYAANESPFTAWRFYEGATGTYML